MTIRKLKSRRKAGVLSRFGWPIAFAAYGITVVGGLGTAVVLDQQAVAVPVPVVVQPVEPEPPAVCAPPTPAPVVEAPPEPVSPEPPSPPPPPRQRHGGIKPITGQVADIVTEEAERVGLDPLFMRVVAAIESGGRCGASTGSYHGLFQISDGEFRRRGGQGTVFGCRENAQIAAAKFVEAITNFKFLHGREPTWTELYLTHQQGPAGLSAHLAKPDGIAWRNVRPYYSNAEARRRGFSSGDAYAQAAIWGNVPSDVRSQFRSVDHITSAQFVEVWRRKVEGDDPESITPVAAVPIPIPRPSVVPNPKTRADYVVPCLVVEGPGCSGAPILLPR